MPLKDINVLFVENFLLFNENVHGCNHNTAMKFVKRLRNVANFAKNQGMLFVDPFGNFKVKFERTDRGFYSNAAFLNTGKSKVLEALDQKGRVLLKVEVSLYDRNGTTVMQAVFEWFVTKR